MGVGTLRDDLLRLPGVEQAEIDGDAIAPAGVRVRLSPGVDPAAVGDEIRRVLSIHGLRQESNIVSATPESVVPMAAQPDPSEPPDGDGAVRERQHDVVATPSPVGGRLEFVSVTEGREGITVTAGHQSGTASARTAGPSSPAIDQAVVSAIAELAGVASLPLVRSLDERELAGLPVVTIVLEESGQQLVGSAVVTGGRAYAVGRAAWTALSAR